MLSLWPKVGDKKRSAIRSSSSAVRFRFPGVETNRASYNIFPFKVSTCLCAQWKKTILPPILATICYVSKLILTQEVTAIPSMCREEDT